MAKSKKPKVATELFELKNGKREDARLHDEILNDGKHAQALAVGIATARRLGLSEKQIDKLMKPKS